MEKIILEDGSEREVPTADEWKTTQEKAAQVEALTKDLNDTKAKLEDPANKNWAQLRQKATRAEEELAKLGKALDADGNVVSKQEFITPEKATEIARAAALEVTVGQIKDNLLSAFDEETRKTVEFYYNKLSSGEAQTQENVRKFVTEAARLVSPEASARAANYVPMGGGAPIFKKPEAGSFAETDLAKAVANSAFGKDSYAAPKQ